MSSYRKVLLAQHNEANKCLAEDGEILIAAAPDAKTGIRFRKGQHFFVGLNSGLPSQYGWVSELSEELDIAELLEKVARSPACGFLGKNAAEVEAQVRLTLDSVEKISVNSAVITDFSQRSFMDPTQVQKVHKVFFERSKQ